LKVGARVLLQHLQNSGFEVEVEAPTAATSHTSASLQQQQFQLFKRSLILSWCFAIPTLMLSWVFTFEPVDTWLKSSVHGALTLRVLLEWLLATPAQVIVGYPLYLSAYRAFRYMGAANMDTLMVLSTTTAYCYSLVAAFLAL